MKRSLRSSLWRVTVDQEVDEELALHIEMRTRELVERGMDPQAAREVVLARIGDLGQLKRTCIDLSRKREREMRLTQWLEEFGTDMRFAIRQLKTSPGYGLAAILVLALGLGASTALFAALDRVLFRPLPYTDPNRLVSVGVETSGPFGSIEIMPDKGYVQVWRTTPAPFQSVTATAGMDPCDIAEEQPEQVRCGRVEYNLLRVLGVSVIAGRDFAPEDDVRGAPPVALISHALWVRRYGADPQVTERTLSLDSTEAPLQRVPIVGVLPPDFEMPLERADILLPAQMRAIDPNVPFVRFLRVFARLGPGVTPEQAERLLEPQLAEMRAFLPPSRGGGWTVQPLHNRRVGESAQVGWLLAGAVALFLLIACVNVTNLMLARVAGRQREFAVRAAVGAGRIRLARLALAESLLLALTAGGAGLLVAFALLRTFAVLAPAGMPGIAEASVDSRVFLVSGRRHDPQPNNHHLPVWCAAARSDHIHRGTARADDDGSYCGRFVHEAHDDHEGHQRDLFHFVIFVPFVSFVV